MADCNPTPEVPVPTTLCDRDCSDNVWLEGSCCLLDTLTESQVVYTIQRNHQAREDLKRVTSNARLLELADTVPSLPTVEEGDRIQSEMNAGSIPFYTVFRGRLQ